MDDRIKKLATKLSKSVNIPDLSVRKVYSQIKQKYSDMKEYFVNYSPSDLIKLPLYIFSLKKTGNFDLGEKLINNLHFISLIENTGGEVMTECKSCEGVGANSCDYCSSNGTIECSSCEGTGEVCYNCGEIEEYCTCLPDFEGDGCPDCFGQGEIQCPRCEGSDQITCEKCEGAGEVENPDLSEVVIYTFATWNRNIIDRCESSFYDPIFPAFEQYADLVELGNYLLLETRYTYMELNSDLPESKLYCIMFTTNPDLKFTNGELKLSSKGTLNKYGTERY